MRRTYCRTTFRYLCRTSFRYLSRVFEALLESAAVLKEFRVSGINGENCRNRQAGRDIQEPLDWVTWLRDVLASQVL